MVEAAAGMPDGIDLNKPQGDVTSGEGKAPAAAPTPAAAPPADPPAPDASAAPDDGTGTGSAHPDSALPDDKGSQWFAGLPDDLHEMAGKFTSQEEMARGYQNLESMSGTSIRIPGDDAGENDRKEFLTKLVKAAPELMVKPNLEGDNKRDVQRTLGMPEDSDGYKMPEHEGVDAKALHAELEPLRKMAHEAGMNNEQFVAIADSMIQANAGQNQAAQDAFAQDVATLKNEWGDAYGDRYRAASEIAKRTGAPAMIQKLFTDGNVNTDTIRWMYDLHKVFGGEGSELTMQEGGANINKTPEDAKNQLDEIMSNNKHAYWNAGHPDNQAAIKKVLELRKQADPNLSDDPNLLRGGAIPKFAQT